MQVVCKSNKEDALPKRLRRLAYMIWHDNGNPYTGEGRTDLTPGKSYYVYGVRTSKYYKNTDYFVVKDDMDLPWWMSEYFFESPTGEIPKDWITEEFDYEGLDLDPDNGDNHKEYSDHCTYTAPAAFFENEGGEELIIDREPEGYEIFAKMREEAGY